MANPINTHATGGTVGFIINTTAPNGTTFERGLVPAMALVDSTGADVGTQQTYQLANNGTLAAGATTAAVASIRGGSYIWSYQFAGTSPSLILEALGPDGANYQTIATVTQSGTQGVVLGQGSTVRLRNAGTNQITGLYSSLT